MPLIYPSISLVWWLNELCFNRYSKIHPVLCPNTHHDVTDFVKYETVKNTKTWISSERNIIFLQNIKILDLCLSWYILRSYRFAEEVTFNLYTLQTIAWWVVLYSIDRFVLWQLKLIQVNVSHNRKFHLIA